MSKPTTIEGRKDEFMDYLEQNGVVSNLTEVLISLYEEGSKPKFPVDYLKGNLKGSKQGENEVMLSNNKLRDENKKLKSRINEMEKEIEKLRKQLPKQ